MVPKETKYISQDDLVNDTVVTIRAFEDVQVDDQPRVAMHVEELSKPLLLNRTNAELLALHLGDDSVGAIGQQVTLYVDHSITFGGKRVGGIRLRAATPQSVPSTATVPTPEEIDARNIAPVTAKLNMAEIGSLQVLLARHGKTEKELCDYLGVSGIGAVLIDEKDAIRNWCKGEIEAGF
tara:strand:+ start:68 stop:607 length:540 start_codon:yes stop_codon:yes gene_type:complete